MKTRTLIIWLIILFVVAAVGYHLTETRFPNAPFAICAIVGPLAIAGVCLCVYMEKRKKGPSG